MFTKLAKQRFEQRLFHQGGGGEENLQGHWDQNGGKKPGNRSKEDIHHTSPQPGTEARLVSHVRDDKEKKKGYSWSLNTRSAGKEEAKKVVLREGRALPGTGRRLKKGMRKDKFIARSCCTILGGKEYGGNARLMGRSDLGTWWAAIVGAYGGNGEWW